MWKEKDTFLKLLKKADTQFLVISIPSQSLGTYQIIRSLDVQEVLQDQYIVAKIGTYTIYERKRKKNLNGL